MTSPNVVGEASVVVDADVRNFERNLRRGLDDAADEAERASDTLGRRSGDSFVSGFGTSLAGIGSTVAGGLTKATAAIGALGAAGNALAVVNTAATALAGSLLLIPAAATAAGVAIGTLRLGVQGFADAVAATDAEEFAELAETLAPSAREAAVAVRDLRGAFEEMQNSIQQELFADTSGIITRLGNTFLPILREELSGVAADFNEAGTQTANFLLRGTQIDTIREILANSREATGELSSSMSALVQILLDVVAVGSEFLPSLAGGFGDAAQRAADFVAEARETGALRDFIADSLETLEELGNILNNVGNIAGSVFDAFSSESGGVLDRVAQLTAQFALFLESVEGQLILNTLAESLKTIAQVASTVLRAALEAVLPALTQLLPIIALLAEEVGVVLAEAIRLLVPFIIELVRAILPLVPPILELVSRLLPPLSELLNALIPIVTAVIDILIAVVPPLAAIAENVINMLIPAIEFFAEVLTRVGAVVREVFTFIANIVVTVHTRISEVISTAWRTIRDVVVNAGSAVLNAVRNAFNTVVSVVGNALRSARDAVSNGLANVVRFFRDLPGRIVNAIGNIAGRLFDIGANMIRGLIDGLVSLAQNVLNFFIDLVDRAIGGVLRFLGIASPSRVMREIGRDTGLGLIQGLEDMVTPTEETARMLAAAAAGAAGSIANQFSPFSGATLGGFTQGGGGGTAGVSLAPSFTVDVRIGETPLNDIMDVRIREHDRLIRRRTPLRGRV